jgi:putative molybdopterin biosynthesis protein
MHERNIYLDNIDIEEAVSSYLKELEPAMEFLNKEKTATHQSLGRVLSEPLFAVTSSPGYNGAAMDGIMVSSEATKGASEAAPLTLLRGKDFEEINTGFPIREPFDAVIMIEDLVFPQGEEGDQVIIKEAAFPWQHIRAVGEDIVAGEMLFPAHHRMRPMDVGAALAAGIGEITVYEKVRVGIMPTGTEILEVGKPLEKGKIYDSNSWTFQSICEEMGAVGHRVAPVKDEIPLLKEALLRLIKDNHMVLINAGSSAGSKDHTAGLIRELGEVYYHGLSIKPGKPTVLGKIQGKPVIGVPGFPGSAFLVFEEVVAPVIRKLQRIAEASSVYTEAVLSRRLISSLKYREYVRVKLGRVEEKLIATPLARGAGMTTTLVKADGLLVIPKNSEGMEAGEKVQVALSKDFSVIDKTLVSIGSHDMVMDFIGSLMEEGPKGFHLSSAHVGSMGGIMAMKRGEAHIAPVHLLDEETGVYNQSYVERYLGSEFQLIKGIHREQGLMVPQGNPDGVTGIRDLVAKKLTFVNRQRGSGTRMLLDYWIKKEGLDREAILGYHREMTTHMAVAAAVEGGTARVGLGAYSAAKAMGLDFIPLAHEEYDFIVAKRNGDHPFIQEFARVLRSDQLQQILKELGGYGVT